MKALWAVQINLGSDDAHHAIKRACASCGALFRGVLVVPFLNEIPEIAHDGPIIAYGSTRFIKRVTDEGRWLPGAFFDETVFTFAACMSKWGQWMLNRDGVHTTLGDVQLLQHKASADVFVRPNSDLKEFAGGVMRFSDLCDWATTISGGGFEIDVTLPIVVSAPKRVRKEWRVFVTADAGVVAATLYRVDGRLCALSGAPKIVTSFVEDRLGEYMPAPAFALDIGQHDGSLAIVELTDLHSAGFYAADVGAIVAAVSTTALREFTR